jgi:pimeloyl-ACP methyl ester carboxylesterase
MYREALKQVVLANTTQMMSPTAPLANKQLIWHLYSAQAYGIFHGDLDFYFGGWDGRSRVASIDTQSCPVYMLTGEYDWSNTPEMSQKTADKIPGAVHKAMPDLGHFPATENPAKFVPHLIEAIDHIQKVRSENLSTMRLGNGTD